jgi:APA family basic amino acid/polyamine antiporter
MKTTALKKGFGPLDVFAIALGAMISSGLFILPGIAFSKAGPAMIFSYIIAGILVIPTMFAKAELATAMPKAGGVYFFVGRSMGAAPGTLAGTAAWFSLSCKSAFALVGIGAFAILLIPNISIVQIKLIAVGCCIFFMIINILGARLAGKFQIIMVIFLVVILFSYVARGAITTHASRYIPFMPLGIGSVLATAGLVFISYGGLTKVASIAEEVKNPGRNIPLGMFMAFLVGLILYVTVAFVTVGVLDQTTLRTTLTPISEGAKTFWGISGVIITAIAAVVAFISTANAGIMAASRDPMAMSRDRFLPEFFQKVNARFHTPHLSIIFTGIFMVVVILFLGLEDLVKTASTMKILLFIFVNLSLIVMRESKLQNYQPKFKAPLYPWLQLFGIIGCIFLIIEMGKVPLSVTAAFIIGTIIWYFIYVKPRIRTESALMYIVERITDRQIVTDTLREELREIVKERDEIVEDEFDHLLKDAIIFDLENKIHFNEFIKAIAEKLSKRLNIEPKKLIKLFIEREKQSCTALRPGLAIPHIVIKGEKKFEIVLIRAKQGIIFPDAPEPVHIVFVLVGTDDMRNLHLRALMAIAQITEQHDFDKKWGDARTIENLRDIILLAKRKRGVD